MYFRLIFSYIKFLGKQWKQLIAILNSRSYYSFFYGHIILILFIWRHLLLFYYLLFYYLLIYYFLLLLNQRTKGFHFEKALQIITKSTKLCKKVLKIYKFKMLSFFLFANIYNIYYSKKTGLKSHYFCWPFYSKPAVT